jgi:hypothetical protein
MRAKDGCCEGQHSAAILCPRTSARKGIPHLLRRRKPELSRRGDLDRPAGGRIATLARRAVLESSRQGSPAAMTSAGRLRLITPRVQAPERAPLGRTYPTWQWQAVVPTYAPRRSGRRRLQCALHAACLPTGCKSRPGPKVSRPFPRTSVSVPSNTNSRASQSCVCASHRRLHVLSRSLTAISILKAA